MKTLQAYRFALDPNQVQLAGLRRHAGASRFGEAFSAGLDRLARALKNVTDSRKGRRKGRRVGFPRFKKRGKARDSFRYTTGTYGPADATSVKLPRIGRVRVHEPMDALTSRLADGRARLLGATVSRTAGRWFVAFTVEVEREIPAGPSRRRHAEGAVGVDLGVKHLAVLSTGETVANPKHYQRAERKLRTAARAYARSKPGSAGRRQCAATLAAMQNRIADQRRDGLHKLTSRLAKNHDVIVVEDLNVAGMVRNRRLAKAVATAGFGEIRRQLAYKTTWYGSTLVVADRWYPSSRTCSGCGWRTPSLTLSDRTFHCQSCGLVLDRDANAAINLSHLVAASTSETENARGADRQTASVRQVAVKREPGTATTGQTGSVTPQEVTT